MKHIYYWYEHLTLKKFSFQNVEIVVNWHTCNLILVYNICLLHTQS